MNWSEVIATCIVMQEVSDALSKTADSHTVCSFANCNLFELYVETRHFEAGLNDCFMLSITALPCEIRDMKYFVTLLFYGVLYPLLF